MIRLVKYLTIVLISISTSFAQIKTEEIIVNNQAIQLPETLTYLEEKTPLIIWVHGSGSVNRDGYQPQYIKQFRDAINKENIAFYSYDKRISNPKNTSFLKDGVFLSDLFLIPKKL